MLDRTVSYKSLLCIIGCCFLLYGIYLIVFALTAQIEAYGDVSYTGPLIFWDPNEVRNYIFCGGLFLGNPVLPHLFITLGPLTPGPLLWVSIGVLCLIVTSKRMNIVYVCLQLALWFISLSVWFPIAFLLRITSYDPGTFAPFFFVTLALSLILLACYKPVTHFLRKLFGSNAATSIART